MLDSYDAFFQQLGQSLAELLDSRDPAAGEEPCSRGHASDDACELYSASEGSFRRRHVEDSAFASRAQGVKPRGRCGPSSGSYGTPVPSSQVDDEDQEVEVRETEVQYVEETAHGQGVEEKEVQEVQETEQEVEETEQGQGDGGDGAAG